MAPPKSILVIGVALLLTAASAYKQQYVQYGYSGTKGPEKWGSLSASCSACSNGKSQSPINIVRDDAVYNPKLQAITRNYTATNATLVNNGNHIGISYGIGCGIAKIDGKICTLKQMHWHTPSEHTLDGKQYPVELHLVHLGSDGSTAVVAVLYKYGNFDPLINQIKNSLDELRKESCGEYQECDVPVRLKTRLFTRKTRKYFRYVGSLTTPPCYENITWTILGKVREISKEQVEALKAPLTLTFQHNARPLQPLNGRKVQLYDELYDGPLN